MRFCYLDESGTPELTGGTSHFVLLGLSIQGETWKVKDAEISRIKRRYGLEPAEIHTGWLSRRYLVQRERDAFLIKKAALHGPAAVVTDRRNFNKTKPYIHRR